MKRKWIQASAGALLVTSAAACGGHAAARGTGSSTIPAVMAIDPLAGAKAGAPLAAGNGPESVIVTHDGKVLAADAGYVNKNTTVAGYAVAQLATTPSGKPRLAKSGPQVFGLALGPGGDTAYIATGNGVSAYDVATGQLGQSILRALDVDTIAMSPDGGALYIGEGAGLGSSGAKVVAIRLSDDQTLWSASLPAEVPSGDWISVSAIAPTPDGKTLFVGQTAVASDDKKVDAIVPVNALTGRTGTPIVVGGNPQSLVVTPDGKTVYAAVEGANFDGETVVPVSVATGSVGKPISVGLLPEDLAISPDGGTLYVAVAAAGEVVAVNTATNVVESSLKVGGQPYDLAVAPSGRVLYVAAGRTTVIPVLLQ